MHGHNCGNGYASAFGRRPDCVDPEALADAVADRCSRVEAGVRVLEDDLHPAPVGLQGRAAHPGDNATPISSRV